MRTSRFSSGRFSPRGFRVGVGDSTSGVPDTTAPVIANLVVDDTTDPVGISFDVSEDSDVYGIWTVDSEQASITADDIIAGKLQDGTTDAPLAFGPVSVTEPTASFTDDLTTLSDGLVRLYMTAQDAAGNKAAVVSDSFVVSPPPASIPQIMSVIEEVSGAYGTLDVDIGPTTASDSILIIIASSSGTATFSAPNFTVISDSQTLNVNNRPVVMKWDGTGTRPSSTTVTVTASPGHTFNAMSVVVSGTTVSAAVELNDTTAAVSSTGPTITAAANSLVFHVFAGPSDGAYAFTNSAPTPAPTKDAYIGNLPTGEIFGRLDIGSGGSLRSLMIITDEQASAGTSVAATLNSAFGFTGQWVSFGVSP